MWFQATTLIVLVGAVMAATVSPTRTRNQDFFDTIPEPEKPFFISYSLVLVVYEHEAVPNSTVQATKGELITKSNNIHIPRDVHIPEDLWQKFQLMATPEDFPTNLFNWVCSHYKMDKQAVEELLLKEIYCFPDGTCMDLGDVGNTCCPF